MRRFFPVVRGIASGGGSAPSGSDNRVASGCVTVSAAGGRGIASGGGTDPSGSDKSVASGCGTVEGGLFFSWPPAVNRCSAIEPPPSVSSAYQKRFIGFLHQASRNRRRVDWRAKATKRRGTAPMLNRTRAEGSGTGLTGSRRQALVSPSMVPQPTICPLSFTLVAYSRVQPESAGIKLLRSVIVPFTYTNARPQSVGVRFADDLASVVDAERRAAPAWKQRAKAGHGAVLIEEGLPVRLADHSPGVVEAIGVAYPPLRVPRSIMVPFW